MFGVGVGVAVGAVVGVGVAVGAGEGVGVEVPHAPRTTATTMAVAAKAAQIRMILGPAEITRE
jgi:hypothetical protein